MTAPAIELLREALRWYADPQHWKVATGDDEMALSPIDADFGRRAREALFVAGRPAVVSAMERVARAHGQKGGIARAASLSPDRRSEIARGAALARWHREPEAP